MMTTFLDVSQVKFYGQSGLLKKLSILPKVCHECGVDYTSKNHIPKKETTSNVKTFSLIDSKNSQTIFVYTQGLTGRYEEVKTMITRAIFSEVLTQMADCGFCQSGFGHVLIRLNPPTKCSRWQKDTS